MVKSIYCDFSTHQIAEQKRMLHSLIHWLLIYKEENNKCLDNHFDKIMHYIGGLNALLFEPPEILTLLITLQSAWDLSREASCDFQMYRAFIFDAHTLIDKLYKSLAVNENA